MAHSVLVVPVPALEPFVRRRWEHYEPTWVSTDPGFTHAHVTALGPFLPAPTPDELARVAAIAGSTAAFDHVLADIDVFPNGIIHLLPDPSAPFAALTARLWEAFPQCPPYEGQFADVVPHLTLDSTTTGITPAQVQLALAELLPVVVRADRLDLQWYDEGDCRLLASWPLR